MTSTVVMQIPVYIRPSVGEAGGEGEGQRIQRAKPQDAGHSRNVSPVPPRRSRTLIWLPPGARQPRCNPVNYRHLNKITEAGIFPLAELFAVLPQHQHLCQRALVQ